MAKVLVIRKTDKTIHQAPLANKAVLQALNNRLPVKDRFVLEEMDEKEAAKLPPIDKEYVTGGEAVAKVKDLQAENEALKAQLQKLQDAQGGGTETLTAKDLIAKINEAGTEDEVNKLVGEDERVSVLNAAKKRIAEING